MQLTHNDTKPRLTLGGGERLDSHLFRFSGLFTLTAKSGSATAKPGGSVRLPGKATRLIFW